MLEKSSGLGEWWRCDANGINRIHDERGKLHLNYDYWL